MTSKRFFYVQCGLIGLLSVLIIGGAVGGDYILQKQSKKLTDLKIQNKTVENQQSALAQAKRDIEKYADLDKATKAIVPQDKDQAKTVREILSIADQSNIPVKSVTFLSSTLGGTGAAAAGGSTAQSGTATPKPAASQLKAVDGITGVFTFEIQVESSNAVRYQDILNFLAKLEQNRRTAHVTSINLTPDESGRLLNFSLTLNAYVKP